MIDRAALLADLQALLKRLESDLLERSESDEVPDVGQALRAEYKRAKDADRTAQNYEDWRSDAITQTAAAWVLSCVFVRFLEDNKLIDPPKIAGPKARLQLARDEHTLYFQDSERARLTDREYLLSVFDELARLTGTKDVFGEHNPIREVPIWLSGDAAGELLLFFQKIDANTGELIHDFTDPKWDTRFLGDLYQDLSEAAQEKYALLQTPDFVEEFILDRTLDPALDEFGLDATPVTDRQGKPITEPGFRIIDPACGSGHFLLGAFRRILSRRQGAKPGVNVRELVQKTLDSIYGVDINPFAIAIARFRILLAALKASGVSRLVESPAFQMNLACGDSLYHGVERQQMLGDWTDESHYFHTEDAADLRRILREGTFHAVVANPPYIKANDPAADRAYRRLYTTCHRQYSLLVPFMERIFRLAIRGTSPSAGYTGQITANSFMKREFGTKLIEEFIPTIELSHVIDSSGACIPGHNTPTVILFGRNREPVSPSVRAVMGIKGDPETPDVPEDGPVWRAIGSVVDSPQVSSEFVTVADRDVSDFHRHPWNMGGGGAADLQLLIEESSEETLRQVTETISVICKTREDDAYLVEHGTLRRFGISPEYRRRGIRGKHVRHWSFLDSDSILFPYNEDLKPVPEVSALGVHRFLWPAREFLWRRMELGGDHRQLGRTWWEWNRFLDHWYRIPWSIAYAEVEPHNHFVLDRGTHITTGSAPAIKLEAGASPEQHYELLGILNSSIACFWLKQVTQVKTQTTGMDSEAYRLRRAFNTTKVGQLPLPPDRPSHISEQIVHLAEERSGFSADKAIGPSPLPGTLANVLREQKSRNDVYLSSMIRLQEDLDWECYRLYGLLTEDLTYQLCQPSDVSPPSDVSGQEEDPEIGELKAKDFFGIRLGERAFEIVLARKLTRGEIQTTWFSWHGSQPITELPDHWPEDYKRLVQKRIEIIESNPQIALIEQPEYKRRWNTEPWDSQVERALRKWLLDRLERYFDFDGRMNHDGEPTTKIDIFLTTVAKLADVARQDPPFLEVGELYRDDKAFDVQKLVEELVNPEQVPLLSVLRYKPSGLRKREEWEKTWELQRHEDVIDARTQLPKDDPQYLSGDQARDLKQQEIGDIPLPPKYKSSDYISTGGARYWALRGKLDVPNERWVSFPHCEGPDGTLVIAWAGYDHLQLARAISAYFVEIQERLGGRDDPRLVPLLACIIELLPWLKQWHHDIDPDFNQRMDEVYEGFVTEEAKALNMTIDEVKAWKPLKTTGPNRKKSMTT